MFAACTSSFFFLRRAFFIRYSYVLQTRAQSWINLPVSRLSESRRYWPFTLSPAPSVDFRHGKEHIYVTLGMLLKCVPFNHRDAQTEVHRNTAIRLSILIILPPLSTGALIWKQMYTYADPLLHIAHCINRFCAETSRDPRLTLSTWKAEKTHAESSVRAFWKIISASYCALKLFLTRQPCVYTYHSLNNI